jgi:hypothetical protein
MAATSRLLDQPSVERWIRSPMYHLQSPTPSAIHLRVKTLRQRYVLFRNHQPPQVPFDINVQSLLYYLILDEAETCQTEAGTVLRIPTLPIATSSSGVPQMFGHTSIRWRPRATCPITHAQHAIFPSSRQKAQYPKGDLTPEEGDNCTLPPALL